MNIGTITNDVKHITKNVVIPRSYKLVLVYGLLSVSVASAISLAYRIGMTDTSKAFVRTLVDTGIVDPL